MFDGRLTEARVNIPGYKVLAAADEALVDVARSVLRDPEGDLELALTRPLPARRSNRGRTMTRWLYRNWRFLED